MKVNPVMTIVSLAIAALAGYGFYAGNSAEATAWLLALGGGLSVFVTLGALLSVGVGSDARLSVNIKVVAAVFLFVLLVDNLIFSFLSTGVAPYIIVTGILLLIFFVVCYGIGKSGD